MNSIRPDPNQSLQTELEGVLSVTSRHSTQSLCSLKNFNSFKHNWGYLNKKINLSPLKLPQKKTILERQIESTDKQIDELVYELYSLTEEEIKIVESGE